MSRSIFLPEDWVLPFRFRPRRYPVSGGGTPSRTAFEIWVGRGFRDQHSKYTLGMMASLGHHISHTPRKRGVWVSDKIYSEECAEILKSTQKRVCRDFKIYSKECAEILPVPPLRRRIPSPNSTLKTLRVIVWTNTQIETRNIRDFAQVTFAGHMSGMTMATLIPSLIIHSEPEQILGIPLFFFFSAPPLLCEIDSQASGK